MLALRKPKALGSTGMVFTINRRNFYNPGGGETRARTHTNTHTRAHYRFIQPQWAIKGDLPGGAQQRTVARDQVLRQGDPYYEFTNFYLCHVVIDGKTWPKTYVYISRDIWRMVIVLADRSIKWENSLHQRVAELKRRPQYI